MLLAWFRPEPAMVTRWLGPPQRLYAGPDLEVIPPLAAVIGARGEKGESGDTLEPGDPGDLTLIFENHLI